MPGRKEVKMHNNLTTEQNGFLKEAMDSIGYGLWDVTDHHIIWFDKNDNEDEVTHLLAFKSWESAYEYARKIRKSSFDKRK